MTVEDSGERPSWVDEQMDRHGDALAGFRAWLQCEGLIATDTHFLPEGATAGDDDRALEELVDAYIAAVVPAEQDRDAYGIEHADQLVGYAEVLDGWGCLLPDSYRVPEPEDPGDPAVFRADIAEYFTDIVVAEAERRAEQCCGQHR